jgi:hypothetical protein
VLSLFDGGFPLEYALLLGGLRTLDSLGGNRTSGLGRCRIEIPEDVVTWNGSPVLLGTALSSFEEEDWKVMLELARGGEA